MKRYLVLFSSIMMVNQYLFAQPDNIEMIGIWRLEPISENTFVLYTNSHYYYDLSVYEDGEIVASKLYRGFHEDCDPIHIDSLNLMGNGDYYFQFSDRDGVDVDDKGNLHSMIRCLSVVVEDDPEETILRFGRGSLAEYKKVYKLPDQLVTYLEQEHPEVYDIYCDLATNK